MASTLFIHSLSGGKKIQVPVTLIFIIALVCLSYPGAHRKAAGGVSGVHFQQMAKAGAMAPDTFETKPVFRKATGMGSIHLCSADCEWLTGGMPFHAVVWAEQGVLPCAGEVRGGFHERAPPASV